MIALLDTCALLWYTLEPDSLSLKAQRTLAAAESIIVCSVSVWEIGIKTIRNKLELGTTFEDYVERIARAADFVLEPIDYRLWTQSVLLPWKHRDPADRLIVARAQQLDATIVTDDQVIKKFYAKVAF
jgi:PIN domain nuclease of toxin-antitoxin system